MGWLVWVVGLLIPLRRHGTQETCSNRQRELCCPLLVFELLTAIMCEEIVSIRARQTGRRKVDTEMYVGV